MLFFTPEPRTRCGAAGEHDSDSSLDFAKRIFMSKLPVTGHGVNSNEKVGCDGFRPLLWTDVDGCLTESGYVSSR